MYRSCVFGLLAGSICVVGATQAAEQQFCRPALAFKEIRFSEMRPPTMERKWTAVLLADASRCSTTSGRFEIVFSRQKENGVEIEFQEQFMWNSGLVEVSIDFWADEAVEGYWIHNVAPCPCRD
jgi:hypothetical protein